MNKQSHAVYKSQYGRECDGLTKLTLRYTRACMQVLVSTQQHDTDTYESCCTTVREARDLKFLKLSSTTRKLGSQL